MYLVSIHLTIQIVILLTNSEFDGVSCSYYYTQLTLKSLESEYSEMYTCTHHITGRSIAAQHIRSTTMDIVCHEE